MALPCANRKRSAITQTADGNDGSQPQPPYRSAIFLGDAMLCPAIFLGDAMQCQRHEERGGAGEQQAVDAVEYAAVAAQQPAGVLHPHVALQIALEKGSQRSRG